MPPIKLAEKKIEEFVQDVKTLLWPSIDLGNFALKQLARLMVRRGWERKNRDGY